MARECNVMNMRLFVAGLFSGDYEQDTGTLNRNGKFCCLGVACEVAIKNGLEVEKKTVAPTCGCGIDHQADGRISYDGETGVLPAAVADWLGLEDETGDGRYSERRNPRLAGRTATAWNDVTRASFQVIGELFSYEYLDGRNYWGDPIPFTQTAEGEES